MGVAQTVAQKESKMPKYVERRGNVLYFRRRAPSPLKPGDSLYLDDRKESVHANGYVRFSLETSDLKVAGQLARKYAHFVDEAAKDAATGVFRPKLKDWEPAKPLEPGAPTPEEIRFAAESMYVSLLGTDELVFNSSLQKAFDQAFGSAAPAEEDEEERQSDRHHWSAADLPPLTPQGQAQLIKEWIGPITFALYQHTGKTITEPGPTLLPFADAIRRFVIAMEKRRVEAHVPTPPQPHKGEIWTWQQALEYCFEQRPDLSEGSRANYRIAWNSLAESAKGTPAGLTKAAVVAWRDGMFKKLARRTAKNRLTQVGSIWRESLVNAKIPPGVIDPFDGLQVRVDENGGSSREEFSVAELKTLFDAPPLSTDRAVSVQAGYWLPLLALYHGPRLLEITGLEVRDIEDWGDSLVMHIRENTIRENLKHGKLSERSMPVHPKLIELGFKDYVTAARESGLERLFPGYSRGATFGEAFVAHAKELLNPVEGRLVGMHCFRHCWETARRNGRLDTSASQYMTGRKMEKGSSADYGSQAGLCVLLEELSKIEYPTLKFGKAPPVTAAQLKQQDAVRKHALRAKKGRKIKAAIR